MDDSGFFLKKGDGGRFFSSPKMAAPHVGRAARVRLPHVRDEDLTRTFTLMKRRILVEIVCEQLEAAADMSSTPILEELDVPGNQPFTLGLLDESYTMLTEIDLELRTLEIARELADAVMPSPKRRRVVNVDAQLEEHYGESP